MHCGVAGQQKQIKNKTKQKQKKQTQKQQQKQQQKNGSWAAAAVVLGRPPEQGSATKLTLHDAMPPERVANLASLEFCSFAYGLKNQISMHRTIGKHSEIELA